MFALGSGLSPRLVLVLVLALRFRYRIVDELGLKLSFESRLFGLFGQLGEEVRPLSQCQCHKTITVLAN